MKKEFRTHDIVLAATLKLHNFTLNRIEKVGNKGYFIFVDVDSEFLVNYDLDKVHVSPVAFNSIIKQLTTSVRRMP